MRLLWAFLLSAAHVFVSALAGPVTQVQTGPGPLPPVAGPGPAIPPLPPGGDATRGAVPAGPRQGPSNPMLMARLKAMARPVASPQRPQNSTADEQQQPQGVDGVQQRWQEGGFFTQSPWNYGCPFNWYQYNGRCFMLFEPAMAWIDAEKYCQHFGANLASIHYEEEYEFIRYNVMAYNEFVDQVWIGGNDAIRSGEWLWSDGSGFQTWSNFEPINCNRWKHCLSFRRWESEVADSWFCDAGLPFICATRPDRYLF